MSHVAHWDDVRRSRREFGHMVGSWRDLGGAAGSMAIGVKRIEIEPGLWSTPAHVELAEEEIFYVLGGSGLSWQDGETYEVGAGDCLVHLSEAEAHTLRAGPGGLDVLAFGMRVPAGGALLRRAGIAWHWPGWVEAPGGKHPFEREADAGPPPLPPEPSPRPSRIVATADVAEEWFRDIAAVRRLGKAGGSVLTGLNHVAVRPGAEAVPPHCHGAEEELFVVLDGTGTCRLGEEELPVHAGSLIARPAGTRIPHSFEAGPGGLTYLVYGTREPNDIVYYPRTNELFLRGVGVRFAVPDGRG